jgi:lactoylglutathione lyase
MKFGYTIVYVPSVPDTLTFYEQAFGLQRRFLHDSGEYGELDTGSTVLAFASHAMGKTHLGDDFSPVAPTQPPPGIELAFVTDEVEAAYARAIAAGATSLHPPQQKPWGQTVAYVRALEGTLIELCTPIRG